jgi:hypothetical protein
MLNFSGNSRAGTGLPVYLIATIILVIIVVLFCIGIAYFQFVYKKRIEERNKKPMREIWVTEFVDIDAHKSIINSNMLENNNTFTSESINKSGISQIEIIDNEVSDISGLECFKYNSDAIEVEDNDIKPLNDNSQRLY